MQGSVPNRTKGNVMAEGIRSHKGELVQKVFWRSARGGYFIQKVVDPNGLHEIGIKTSNRI